MNANILIAIVLMVIIIAILISRRSPSPVQDQNIAPPLGSDTADVLLLTCLDYRFFERIAAFMNKKGYTNNYDQFILAGASLGLAHEVNPMIAQWNQTWWDHLKLAVQLHKVKKVIIIDHEDCGAYRELLGFDNKIEDLKDPNIIPIKEVHIHSHYLKQAYSKIKKAYPSLIVELYLIGLTDNIIPIVAPTPTVENLNYW